MPSRSLKALVLPVVVLTLAAATHLLHRASSARPLELHTTDETPRVFVPDGQLLSFVSFGQLPAVSDLYWLKLIQYVGTPAADKGGWPQLLPLAELVTDLDPLHGYAYEVSGLLLSSKKRFDESNQILGKGMEAVPTRWQLPFFAAFNHYFELDDQAEGARLLERASKLPERPEYVPLLAARLYASANSAGTGLAFVQSMLASIGKDDPLREELEKRRDELLIENDLQLLEKAIASFEEREGRKPGALDELLGKELRRLPLSPTLNPYDYDPTTGEVSSKELPERLRYVAPPSGPAVSGK